MARLNLAAEKDDFLLPPGGSLCQCSEIVIFVHSLISGDMWYPWFMNRVILAILQTVPGSEKVVRANAIESLLLPVKGVHFPAIYDTYKTPIPG